MQIQDKTIHQKQFWLNAIYRTAECETIWWINFLNGKSEYDERAYENTSYSRQHSIQISIFPKM